MGQERELPPGVVITYPNREKPTSKLTKTIVVGLLLASVALMLLVTIGGWSKLQGMRPMNFLWAGLFLIFAFYTFRWVRGLLPIATAFSILLLIISAVAGLGAGGNSWSDRTHPGYGPAQSMFGTPGFGGHFLEVLVLLLVPIQAALIFFAMYGFSQGWNVEVERHIDELRGRGRGKHAPTAPQGQNYPPSGGQPVQHS